MYGDILGIYDQALIYNDSSYEILGRITQKGNGDFMAVSFWTNLIGIF
jgi:hypothetical protein